jgi:hypothetical protein
VDPRDIHVTRRWTGKNGNFDRVRGWFVEEVRLQARGLVRFGVLALIDEDGQGLLKRQGWVAQAVAGLGLPSIDPSQGRLLVIPVRNIETWMVWAARRQAASPRAGACATPACHPVNETHDYKRWVTPAGEPLPREPQLDAFLLGRVVATLNPANPPDGVPAALSAILRPWCDFLRWARGGSA